MAVTDNRGASRYEQQVNGATVFAQYRREGKKIFITHVEAPSALRGTGAASTFMQALMETLRGEGVAKVVPLCSYAAAWLARHSEFNDLT
jgi:predicted GNAT family acetyltransferase